MSWVWKRIADRGSYWDSVRRRNGAVGVTSLKHGWRRRCPALHKVWWRNLSSSMSPPPPSFPFFLVCCLSCHLSHPSVSSSSLSTLWSTLSSSLPLFIFFPLNPPLFSTSFLLSFLPSFRTLYFLLFLSFFFFLSLHFTPFFISTHTPKGNLAPKFEPYLHNLRHTLRSK